jgi:hypothetical protein
MNPISVGDKFTLIGSKNPSAVLTVQSIENDSNGEAVSFIGWSPLMLPFNFKILIGENRIQSEDGHLVSFVPPIEE